MVDTLRTGKGGELAVIGELIDKGFNIYTPVSDNENIDCIIKNKNRHIDIQIKTRESVALWDVRQFEPRDNFFIICYLKTKPRDFWVIPSKIFLKNSINLKGYNKYRLILSEQRRRILAQYINDFEQLRK